MIQELRVGGRRAVAQLRMAGAPTLLLLHGAGGNHHSYDELLPHLQDTSYAVPSLPGRCGSEGTAPASASDAAAWLVDFVRGADLGPTIVCGHSYGGALAMELALQASDAIELRGLVLLATGARLRVNPMILQVMEQGAASGEPVALGGFAFRSKDRGALVARVEAASAKTPPAAALADWRAANAFDRMLEIASIMLPTLVVAGEEDTLTPTKYARYLADQIPRASLRVLPEAGHMFPAEQAAKTAELLTAFMRHTIDSP